MSQVQLGSTSPAQVAASAAAAAAAAPITVPPGKVGVSFIRSYSEKFKPRNGTYTADMNGRLYITVSKDFADKCKSRHYRTTRVITAVTSSMSSGTVQITAADWSSNPLDADPLAAGRVSQSIDPSRGGRGYVGHPDTEKYEVHDEDGNLISTELVWEPCENPDPAPVAAAATTNLGV